MAGPRSFESRAGPNSLALKFTSPLDAHPRKRLKLACVLGISNNGLCGVVVIIIILIVVGRIFVVVFRRFSLVIIANTREYEIHVVVELKVLQNDFITVVDEREAFDPNAVVSVVYDRLHNISERNDLAISERVDVSALNLYCALGCVWNWCERDVIC